LKSIRHGLHLKVKVCRVGSDMQSVETSLSLVMQTCQNNLGLNLCVMPPTSCKVAISKNGLVRSCKERDKAHRH